MNRRLMMALAWALTLFIYLPPAFATTYAKPNVLIVLTDDQTLDAITGRDAAGRWFMPFIASKRPLARKFDQFYFTQSLCCPSRTSLLTGMYPHNHGVVGNGGALGGYSKFVYNGLDVKSWPYFIRGNAPSGYFTVLLGKFLNLYGMDATLPTVPRGYHHFLSIMGGYTPNMFRWRAIKNGKLVSYDCPTDACYQTNVLTAEAIRVIDLQATQYKRPFAMILTPFSPHLPAMPAKKYAATYANEPFQPANKAAFNEADVSDKPGYIQAAPLLTPTQINAMTVEWRNSIASARSVDDMFRDVWLHLEATGQLANTYIIFASDNGYSWGEHRVHKKIVPYRESIASIMFVWGPGVVPAYDHHIVSTIDVFPTIMEIAGKPSPSFVGGRSLMPLLRGENPATWRTGLLVQGRPPNDSEGGSLEFDGREYTALATRKWSFIDYDGEREFYDLATDPDEMNNTAAALDPAFVAAVQARIDALYACTGAGCAAIEDLPLPPH